MTDTNVLDIFADLRLTIGDLNDNVKRLHDAQDEWRSLQETPKFARIHGQVTLTAGGFGVVGFDNAGPDRGRLWYVRKLALSGAVSGSTPTPDATVTGRADIFVSAMDYRTVTALAGCGVQDWVDQATTLPLVGNFNAGELVVQHGERLFVVFSGGTNAGIRTVVGLVEDFQAGSYKSDWAL